MFNENIISYNVKKIVCRLLWAINTSPFLGIWFILALTAILYYYKVGRKAHYLRKCPAILRYPFVGNATFLTNALFKPLSPYMTTSKSFLVKDLKWKVFSLKLFFIRYFNRAIISIIFSSKQKFLIDFMKQSKLWLSET
jgi:hypothetical protein